MRPTPSHIRLSLLLLGLAGAAWAVPDSTNAWGYGYDSLLRDLAAWRRTPWARVDSIGATGQGRAIWMVSVTDSSDSLASVPGRSGPKHRIVLHARTHPREVQAQRNANGALRTVLDTGVVAAGLRRDFVFNVIPMANPDGVELGRGRHNGRGVNLESNWNRAPAKTQPEVLALRARFEQMDAGKLPVEVALNLHSDTVRCTRFFVYHLAIGTSMVFGELEKQFIAGVQAHFPAGIRDYSFLWSWSLMPGLQYPEGFWWSRRHEQTMALTYEDSNCPDADQFARSGRALVLGASDYVRREATYRRSTLQGF